MINSEVHCNKKNAKSQYRIFKNGTFLLCLDTTFMPPLTLFCFLYKISFLNFDCEGAYMSGHSKWATIKHAKGAADAKRGQLFTKFVKEISIAAKNGGDPASNPRLRTAILKARAANMPNDNIERAIKKGTGELGGAVYEELLYEGYGPGGVAVLVEVLTDNKNRSAAAVRNHFTKSGGNLGATGSVAYMFNRKGVIEYDSEAVSEDELMESALEVGAEDIESDDGIITVTTDPNEFENVLEALQGKGFASISAEVSMVPDNYVTLGAEEAKKVLKMIDRLEEDDDVQNVYTNMDIPDGLELDE